MDFGCSAVTHSGSDSTRARSPAAYVPFSYLRRSREVKVFVLVLGLITVSGMRGGQMAESEIHLIPAGYIGNIYIFHNVPDGEPLKREGRARVYEIPKDGILRSQTPMNPRSFTPQYFYVASDGKREEIVGYWPTSIHDTPENRADKTIGVFFRRTGSLQGVTTKTDGTWSTEFPCDIQFDEYYVGTKLYLLSSTNLEKDLHSYVKEHPVCK